MSLINEMLKDLETRGGNRAGGVVRVPPAAAKRRLRWLPLALLATLVIAIAAVLLRMSIETPARTITAFSTAVVTEPQTPVDTVEVDTPASVVVTEPDPTPVEEPINDALEAPVNAAPAAAAVEPDTVAPVIATTTPETEDLQSTVIVRRHEPTPAQKAARATREGFAALHRGDWTSAARLLQELVVLDSANDDAREGLYLALAQLGRIAEADAVLLDGIAVGTNPARFAKLRARLLAARGDVKGALDSLSIAVPPVKTDAEYHALRGALAQQTGEHLLAADAYAALVAVDARNGTWQAGLAMALDALGDIEGARNAYARALEDRNLESVLRAHAERRAAALAQ